MKQESIIQRNVRVDADKAWETSKMRRAAIALLMYIVIVVFLFTLNVERPWLHALVPVAGFILSTLAIAPLKQWWLAKIYKK